MSEEVSKPNHFIHNIIEEHNTSGRFGGVVHTRFPPEPNGYLHIGHAKAICINFTTAQKYGGKCNLRFDDTNPLAEDVEFINSIKEDIQWLGFEWDELHHASDYFDQLYDFAVQLIKDGKAYVCSLSEEETREYRGNHTTPGKNSPYRDRSVEENLDLFEKMKNGEFKDGEHVLRVKIDMSSGNMNMRDPLIYRIRHTDHPVTGNKWCIYPLYDYTHCISDSLEGITHSLCTLEFEDHRPLYDWFLDQLGIHHTQQIEFSKLNLSYIALSKRRLRQLVEENYLDGWDDPRMPTIRGFRRRGYTPASIRSLVETVGVTKVDSVIDFSIFEEALRTDLNENAARRMAVLDPLKVTITNFEGETLLKASNHPKKPEMGEREIPFSNEIFIDREDFMEDPPKKYFRLKPGGEVRLRSSYVIKCEEVIKDDSGKVIELKCTLDPETLGKKPEGRKVKGIIHWVCAKNHEKAEVRLYDRLYKVPNPLADKEKDFKDFLNEDSLKIVENVPVEATVKGASKESSFQFERLGYFCVDSKFSSDEKLVFNRSVTLKDTWAKVKD